MSNPEPNYELNAQIAVMVFGWRWHYWPKRHRYALMSPLDSEWTRYNWAEGDTQEMPVDFIPPVEERFPDWYRVCARNNGLNKPMTFLPDFSGNIADAWLIVEEIEQRGFHWMMKTPFWSDPEDEEGNFFWAGFTEKGATGFNGRPDYYDHGPTMPLAICAPALIFCAMEWASETTQKEEEKPTLASLKGIAPDATGGQKSEDFVREQRA